ETGYTAAQWSHLTSIVTTPGITDEVIHCYLAEGLTKAEQHTDEDEFIDVVELSWQEVKQGILDGTIYDSKSLSAILAYLLRNGINI
ncbi:MAG: NUDIX hydrolase, partial [Acidaminococcaceae bacterium]|nr:NUDIX hydrolase [Acidaminococcaceae bacterium]